MRNLKYVIDENYVKYVKKYMLSKPKKKDCFDENRAESLDELGIITIVHGIQLI